MYLQLALTVLMASAAMCYDEKFDKVDPKQIISDDALFMSYLNCFLDKGPCTAEYAEEYKEILPEVVAEGCGKCTPLQKDSFKIILNELFLHKKDLLMEFEAKYDPKNEYKEKILALMGQNKE